MPNVTRPPLPLTRALDEGLATLFSRLQAEPAPASLVGLADRLEAAWLRRSTVADEARAIGWPIPAEEIAR
jgi:hypothetical protein